MSRKTALDRYAQGRHNGTRYERWYDREAGSGDDFTFGEWVWREARKDLLREQRQRKKRKSS